MKKNILRTLATSFVLLALGTFASAEAYINANDVEEGTITSEKKFEDGFSIIGTPEKLVKIDKHGADVELPKNAAGESFSQRINLKGSGSKEYRCVKFSAKAGQKITVDCATSSKTDTRALKVIDETGKEVLSISAQPTNSSTTKIYSGSVKAPSTSTYYAYSEKGGMYIYEIVVE